MEVSKRLIFLESYIKLYGVEKIELKNVMIDSVCGIAIYDKTDLVKKQEFIWYKSEKEVPPPELNILIEKIIMNK